MIHGTVSASVTGDYTDFCGFSIKVDAFEMFFELIVFKLVGREAEAHFSQIRAGIDEDREGIGFDIGCHGAGAH